MKAIHIRVTGRVQGVYFRANTKKRAVELNLRGWVKNTPDGAVEAAFEGEEGRLQEILSWCRTGPPGARVEKITGRGYRRPRGETSRRARGEDGVQRSALHRRV